jgi:hypothetical protein
MKKIVSFINTNDSKILSGTLEIEDSDSSYDSDSFYDSDSSDFGPIVCNVSYNPFSIFDYVPYYTYLEYDTIVFEDRG